MYTYLYTTKHMIRESKLFKKPKKKEKTKCLWHLSVDDCDSSENNNANKKQKRENSMSLNTQRHLSGLVKAWLHSHDGRVILSYGWRIDERAG